MSDELIARVTGVIAKTQHLPPESVTIDRTFEELNIDSLDGINILFAVESEFDISIPDQRAPEIRSVRDMVEGIEQLLAQKQAAAKGQPPAAPPDPASPQADPAARIEPASPRIEPTAPQAERTK